MYNKDSIHNKKFTTDEINTKSNYKEITTTALYTTENLHQMTFTTEVLYTTKFEKLYTEDKFSKFSTTNNA